MKLVFPQRKDESGEGKRNPLYDAAEKFFERSLNLLERVSRVPENIRQELELGQTMWESLRALENRGRLRFEHYDGARYPWVLIKPQNPERAKNESIILNLRTFAGGRFTFVRGMYVAPKFVDGEKSGLWLTEMDPEQVRQLVYGLLGSARSVSKVDAPVDRNSTNTIAQQDSADQSKLRSDALGKSAGRGSSYFGGELETEEVIKEAERILDEAWEETAREYQPAQESQKNRARGKRPSRFGFRLVSSIEDFYMGNPIVVFHANMITG